MLGSSQSGHRSSLRLLEVAHHEDVIIDARQVAQTLIGRDPELHTAPALAAAIELVERAEQADYLEKA